MTMLSPAAPARSHRTVLPPSNPEELWDLAERLNGRPVPGVRLTERQFVDWCPEEVLAEWVGGDVVLIPPETPTQNQIKWLVASVVRSFTERHYLGEVFVGTVPVRLPGSRRIPDLSFVRSSRSHVIGDTLIDGAPDLIAEAVSSDSVERDWVDKRAEYERAGVREYWIADPRHDRFAAYGLHGKTYRTIRPDGDGRVQSRVLKGLYIRPA